jgi:hypothetical protein
MNKILLVPIVTLVTILHASESKIVETESEVIVEYTGSPSYFGHTGETPTEEFNDGNKTMEIAIAARIEQLKKEVSDLLQPTGKQTDAEVAVKKALAEEKISRIASYVHEIDQLAGRSERGDASRAGAGPPIRPQHVRQEKKARLRELKKSRVFSPLPADSP